MPYPIFIPVLSLLSAALFALIWNMHVARQEKNGVEGEAWLWVVIGVGFTVLCSGAVIGWINMLWEFVFFAVSGLPMIVGSKFRHHKKDKRFTRRLQEMGKDANDTTPTR